MYSSKKPKGFTLIELMVVMVIIGSILGIVTTNLDSLTPSSRISASAREISSSIQLAMSNAIITGTPTAIYYDLDKNYHQVRTKNQKGEYENLSLTYLLRGVTYQDIDVMEEKKHKDGWLQVEISPLGTMAGHVIHLINEEGIQITLEVNPLSGIVEIKKGYAPVSFLKRL